MSIERDGDGPPLRRQEPKAPQTSDGRADLRATPFTDDVFSEDDYRGRRTRRAAAENKSFSVIVGVVLGVVVAGGAGWFFLRDGFDLAVTADSAGFIKADPNPYKVRPENPGGMQVENQDKLVYDRVAKGNAPNRVENLLPPAEEPKAPPRAVNAGASNDGGLPPGVKKPEPAPAVVEAPKPAPAAEVAKVEPAMPEPAKPEVAAVEAPKVEPAKPEPAKVEAAKEAEAEEAPEVDLAAAIAAATGGASKAAVVKPAETPAEATPAETKVAAVPSPAPAAGGAFHIQLASVLSEEAAQAEWKRVSGKNKELLGAYKPLITKADLGERGAFFRLRAGPLADKAAADALCTSLKEIKVGCIVIKP